MALHAFVLCDHACSRCRFQMITDREARGKLKEVLDIFGS